MSRPSVPAWEAGMHPPGFYPMYPMVTWDLAAERWVGIIHPDRSDLLYARCRSCNWMDSQLVPAKKPERRRVAEFIIECQHWYSCTNGPPQMKFIWELDLPR